MGEKLVRIFEIVMERVGVQGRLALASKTGISMAQAAELEDTEELVNKLKYAASDVYEAHHNKTNS